MSTIQANAILDASGGNTVTVNGVTPNTDTVKGRNLIINGAMQVAQRNTSATTATSSAYFGPDRFKYFLNGGGDYTVAQDTGHLAATGHDKAIKIAITTADTSIAAGDYYSFLQRIEAKNVQHLQWGTASAKSLTLSFWVRATKTGTQALHFAKQGSGTDYRYIAEYTISASDTWEYKTITVPGLTADTIVDDSSTYIQVGWMLKYGSDFQGTKDVWTTSAHYTTAASVNHMDSTSNTLYLTGVKLEVGSVATEYDHRSYAEELQLCKRYFNRWNQFGEGPGFANALVGVYNNASTPRFQWKPTVELRTAPTVTKYGANSDYDLEPFDRTPSGITALGSYRDSVDFSATDTTGGTQGHACWLVAQNGNAYIDFDSEL